MVLSDILNEHGPSLSSNIQKCLVVMGYKEANSRKIVERAIKNNKIQKLYGINFPKNQSFLYYGNQFDSELFWSNLLEAFRQTNSIYALTIDSIISRDGTIPYHLFKYVSGAPYKLKKQLNFDTVLKSLIRINALQEIFLPHLGRCLTLNDKIFSSAPSQNIYARLFIEDIFISALKEWLKKNSLVSYNSIYSRDLLPSNDPIFFNFYWDLTAPTYILPFRFNNNPGFMVADIILKDDLNIHQIAYFVRKCKLIRSYKKHSPFISLLIANSFTQEAFQFGKTNGIVLTTPAYLLGDDIAKAFIGLINCLTNAAAVASKDIDKFLQIFDKLNKIEGVSHNLRGPLFEFIVAHSVKAIENGYLEIGKVIGHSQKVEIDVLLANPSTKKITFYECKAYQQKHILNVDDVNEWFNNLAKIQTALREEKLYFDYHKTFELWTTSNFDDDALKLLNNKKKISTKININWKNNKDVVSYINQDKTSRRAKEILREQFSLNHLF